MQGFLEVTQRLRCDPLRLFFGVGDYRLGLSRRLLLSSLIGGERPLRLVAQIRRRRELVANTQRASVERTDNEPPDRLPDHDNEDRYGEKDPEFRVAEQMSHQLARSVMARSTAAARLDASGAEPVNFSVIDRPTSI